MPTHSLAWIVPVKKSAGLSKFDLTFFVMVTAIISLSSQVLPIDSTLKRSGFVFCASLKKDTHSSYELYCCLKFFP